MMLEPDGVSRTHVNPDASPEGRLLQCLLVFEDVIQRSEGLRREAVLFDNNVCGMQTVVHRTCASRELIASMQCLNGCPHERRRPSYALRRREGVIGIQVVAYDYHRR